MKISIGILALTLYATVGLLHADTIITTYRGIIRQRKQQLLLENLAPSNFSFHFLLTTIGRNSLLRMLDSLENQVEPQDHVTIVFDAKDVDNVLETVTLKVRNFPCTVNIFFENENLGYWGHGIRNKYATDLTGDFILHCDDDNSYLPGTINVIRRVCRDSMTLYLFKVQFENNRTVWKTPKIYYGNIDTACGAIPRTYNSYGTWEYFHGGDSSFYLQMCKKIIPSRVVFVDFPIYQMRK